MKGRNEAGDDLRIAERWQSCFHRPMSLETLKMEAARLDEQSRKELVTFLVSLRDRQPADRARRLTEIRDSRDPSRWLTPEEFRERLDRIAEPADDPARE